MKLSLNTFVTIDGVMQGPGGPDEDRSNGFDRGGWLVPHADEDMGRIVDQEWFTHADGVLLGRSTYQMMQPYWSALADTGDLTWRVLNTFPKHVVSTTLTDEQADWANTTVIRNDIIGRVRALKARPGRELQVHGSWQLARTLHDAGLVDVYRLLVFPVVVGAGKRLFDDCTAPVAFRTVSCSLTAAGATSLVLEPTSFSAGAFAVHDGKEAVV